MQTEKKLKFKRLSTHKGLRPTRAAYVKVNRMIEYMTSATYFLVTHQTYDFYRLLSFSILRSVIGGKTRVEHKQLRSRHFYGNSVDDIIFPAGLEHC